MMQYSNEPRTRKHVKGYGFLSFARKYKKQLLDTGLDAVKTAVKMSNDIKMEDYKIYELLNNSTVSKFVTKNWVEVNDLSSVEYSVNQNIRFKTSMLTSDLCDYSDAYIVVKGTIDLLADDENDKPEKDFALSKCSI